MKKLFLITIFLFIGFSSDEEAFAQQRLALDANSALILQELKAVLAEQDKEVVVRMRLGQNDNSSGDKLLAGDVILMANGKRIKKIATIREIYNNLKDNEEIKIGVRRGNERFIVRARKGDMPEGGGVRTMTMGDNSGGSSATAENLALELGILFGDKDGNVIVERFIGMIAPEPVRKFLPESGFILKSINGTTPETAKDAVELIGKIEVGKKLNITFEANGEEKVLSMEKPESNGNFRVQTRNQ